jgi:hypothetical protein
VTAERLPHQPSVPKAFWNTSTAGVPPP